MAEARRPLLGLARAGSYAAEGSGEIGLGFATGEAAPFPLDLVRDLAAARGAGP